MTIKRNSFRYLGGVGVLTGCVSPLQIGNAPWPAISSRCGPFFDFIAMPTEGMPDHLAAMAI
jgi:hypothetical protein